MDRTDRKMKIDLAGMLFLASVTAWTSLAGASDDQRRTGHVQDTSVDPFIVTGEGKPIGDPMPVYWDGVWHLYALSADTGSVPHFTSTDLVTWVEHEPAMVGNGICTGTVLRHENRYYFFFTDGGSQTIRLVTSDNPWEFDHRKSRLVAEADGTTYRKVGWFRDAYVFHDEADEAWWMLVEARCPEVCTGLLKSKNLLDWTCCEPLFKDKARNYGSCPQLLKQDNTYYLAIQDMGNCLYTASHALGPWTDRGQYLDMVIEAASRFASDGKRQITWGWLCDWPVKPKKEVRSYGGPLCVGREMVFNTDGTLGVRALPELSAAIRKRASEIDLNAARTLSGQWKIDPAQRTLRCQGEGGGRVLLALPEKSPDYHFEADLEFDSPGAEASVLFRSPDTADRGYGLALQPARKMVTVRIFNGAAVGGDVLNDRRYDFPGAKLVHIQVFISGDYIEAFLDDRDSLSARAVDRPGGHVAIEVVGGSVTIRRPLLHYFGKSRRPPASGTTRTFIDYFRPMPITGALSKEVWGAAEVGPRDVTNGLEDATMKRWNYWDGQIIKGPEGKYHLFASRWDQAKGHGDWVNSRAVHAVSDTLTGPYIDKGLCWPDDQGGKGHNVTALVLPDGRYGVVVSETRPGTVFVSRTLDGPWEQLGTIRGEGLDASNISIMVRPDGDSMIVPRSGRVFISKAADGVLGPYRSEGPSAFAALPGIPDLEDPAIFWSGGLYHILVNSWSTRKAYHLTSKDGKSGWVNRGVAYDPTTDFIRYTDGTVNHWHKLERPGVLLENGHVIAVTLAVLDIPKEEQKGNDAHGSKILVMPFDGAALDRDLQDEAGGRSP